MTRNNTSHRIFKISELTRYIASQLILISRNSAVNLACVCRYLEEPVLSTLWETQRSLSTLLEVLPEGSWQYISLVSGRRVFEITEDPSPEAWSRVRRYAAWMRQVYVDEWLSTFGDDTFRRLRLNSPATGGWFPALRDLSWCITEYNFPYVDLFFSPYLEKVSIHMSSAWMNSEIPHDILPAIISTISAIPGPTLQRLLVSTQYRMVSWEDFKESLSSVVLRCGPSLTELTSPIPLSDAAVDHLIHLPHLHVWRIKNPPPSYSCSPLPLVFPPLTDLTLEESAYEWLFLLGRLEERATATRGVTPLHRVKGSLVALSIFGLSSPMTDSSFASPIRVFRNLSHLDVGVFCHDEGGEGQCIFKLDNNNVTKLAMALPQLEYIQLGHPCFENSCATTVACLLPISVYCVELQSLGIHFNTTTIIEDLKNISKDSKFQELRSLPRCRLSCLDVFAMPLTLDESGFTTVADGMIDIFPSLELCEGHRDVWNEVSENLRHVDALARQ